MFVEKGRIVLEERPVPVPGAGEALIQITTTTICGTDVHILKGEYLVDRGRIVGHEPVGVIAALGPGVTGHELGQRVVVGAITPCGQCGPCLSGSQAQCGGRAMGGGRFGNTIDGAQAEYLLVPHAMANLALVPDSLSDEEVLMCPDIMSTGFGGAESGHIKIGDTVVVFAQGPIGLCATAGARLWGGDAYLRGGRAAAAPGDGVPAGSGHAHQLPGAGPRGRHPGGHGWARRGRRHCFLLWLVPILGGFNIGNIPVAALAPWGLRFRYPRSVAAEIFERLSRTRARA